MMVIVCVYDRAAAAYGAPMFVASEAVAVRSLRQEVNSAEKRSQVSVTPEDFDLYMFGTFDEQKGEWIVLKQPKLLVNGGSLQEQMAIPETLRRVS